jgi:hypothetical protein
MPLNEMHLPEVPAPPQQKTGNVQQCRRGKALMRREAVSR